MARPEEILEMEALLEETAARFAAILEKSGVREAYESMHSVARFEFTSAAEDAAAMIRGTTSGTEASFEAYMERRFAEGDAA